MEDQLYTDKELKQQVQQYQKILGNLHEGYILVDEDANIYDVNPAYCKMVGYSKEELLSMKLTDLRFGMSREYQKEFVADAAAKGSKEFETQHRAKNGSMIDLKASVTVIEQDGKKYLAGIVHNITQQKQEQWQIEESRQRFQSLFEHNPHSVYYMDMEGNYLGVNSKMEKLTGYSEEELLALNFASLITDNDLNRTRHNFEKAAEGEVREYEIVGVAKQGLEKPVKITNFPMIVDDEIVGVFGIAEDLTDKKEAEKKSRESEQHFKSLFEHNPHPVYLFDLEGNFKEVNQKLIEFTGRSRKELLKLGFVDFVDSKDLERTKKQFEKAKKGISGQYEIVVWVQDGTKKEVRITKFPMYVDQKIVGVYGILEDVTKQNKIARELKASNQRWELLVKKSPLPVQVIDQNAVILFINPAGAKLYGAENPEELVGVSILSFNPPESQRKIMERINNILHDKPVGAYHAHTIINKKGDDHYVIVHSTLINYMGQKAVQSVYHDVTEQKQAELKLKQSEERWHRIVEENPKAVQITIDAKIVFINEAGMALYGAHSKDEILGKSVLDFTHPDVLEEVKQRKYNLENGLPVNRVFENKMFTLAGKEITIEVYSIPITYKGEEAIQTAVFDITDRKKREAILQSSLKEKQIMLQEIHHRVKNNMAVISGLLELQAMNTEDKKLQLMLRESQLRIHSMAMIHEKLYASKSLAEINFDEYAKELIQVIRDSIENVDTRVTIRYRMDPGKININQAIPCGLILNELVVNCYKHAFAQQDTGTILIGFSKREKHITLLVEDNGMGLPPDFDLQNQQSLGMTIIQTLTDQLDGELIIKEGANSIGTCFCIVFEEDG